jgi:hypothetical protein
MAVTVECVRSCSLANVGLLVGDVQRAIPGDDGHLDLPKHAENISDKFCTLHEAH